MPDERFGYIILCHHKPEQALRLAGTIKRLSPEAYVLLRHNLGSSYINETQAAAVGADLLISQLTTRWGDWSLVQAALEAFDYARARADPAWSVLISGQDYPIRDLSQWERNLGSYGCDAIVPGEPLVIGPSGLRVKAGTNPLVTRYTHRWYRLPRLSLVSLLPQFFARVSRAVWYRFLLRLQAVVTLNELPRGEGWLLGIRRRRVPWTTAHPCYKGEQWCALSRVAVSVASKGDLAKPLQRYFSRTMIPDEAYFATLLARAPGLTVLSESISWLRWDHTSWGVHPMTLDENLLGAALASGRPFARKFDETLRPGVLDFVDREILRLVSGT